MPRSHIVLVTSDGQALISGRKNHGQTVPQIPKSVGYSSAVAGGYIAGTLFIRTDGQSETCNGPNCPFRFQAPAPPADTQYVMAAAGDAHYALLRSDGQAVVVHYGLKELPAPELPEGVTFTSVAAGEMHTLLLRSDGQAIALSACFRDEWRLVPSPPAGSLYISAAGGLCHSVFIRSDGKAVEFGTRFTGVPSCATYSAKHLHDFEECHVLEAPTGVTYVSAAAGVKHTVLVRSDGRVDAFGDNSCNQCCVPDLPEGVTYVSAAAGDLHTVLIRSDGQAVAFGKYVVNITTSLDDGIDFPRQPPVDIGGEAAVPELPAGVCFVERHNAESVVFMIETKDTGKQVEMIVKFAVSGAEAATLRFSKNRFKTEKIGQLREAIASKAGIAMDMVMVTLPNGLQLKDDNAKMKSLIPEDSLKLLADAAHGDVSQPATAAGYDPDDANQPAVAGVCDA